MNTQTYNQSTQARYEKLYAKLCSGSLSSEELEEYKQLCLDRLEEKLLECVDVFERLASK